MGYGEFKESPKSLITSEQIGKGQIQLFHLAASLFAEIQKIGLHNHSGVGSRKIEISNLNGAFGKTGFVMYSNDGTKRYRITIDNTGTLQATEI